MSPSRRARLAVSWAVVAAVSSSCVPNKVRAACPEMDVRPVICDLSAAGWPIAYIVGDRALSRGSSSSFLGVLIGEDSFHPGAFTATLGAWLGFFAVGAMFGHLRERRRRGS